MGDALRTKYPNLVIRQITLAQFPNKTIANLFENNLVWLFRIQNERPPLLPPAEQGLPFGNRMK